MTTLMSNIDWYRGDSFPIELTIKDSSTTPSIAIDITGYSFKLTVDTLKAPLDDSTKVFEVIGIVDPDQVANTGKLTFTPTAINTDLLPGTYYYDVQMIDPFGNIRTIIKNKWKIIQDITK